MMKLIAVFLMGASVTLVGLSMITALIGPAIFVIGFAIETRQPWWGLLAILWLGGASTVLAYFDEQWLPLFGWKSKPEDWDCDT